MTCGLALVIYTLWLCFLILRVCVTGSTGLLRNTLTRLDIVVLSFNASQEITFYFFAIERARWKRAYLESRKPETCVLATSFSLIRNSFEFIQWLWFSRDSMTVELSFVVKNCYWFYNKKNDLVIFCNLSNKKEYNICNCLPSSGTWHFHSEGDPPLDDTPLCASDAHISVIELVWTWVLNR